VSAGDFLVERPPGYQAMIDAEMVRADLEKAMEAALGHGHGVEQDRLLRIRNVISRMFQVLPKNSDGRIERPMLRYVLHRYFAQQYSISVRGLEPTVNAPGSRDVGAQILLDQVPAFVETTLEGRFAHHGFGLEDVVVMVATLEQLVLGSGAGPLGKAYSLRNQTTGSLLSRSSLSEVLDAYVLQWLVGDSAEINAVELVNNRPLIEESVPQWGEITNFARGEVERHEHERRQAGSGNPFVEQYSFGDAQGIVGRITSGFGHWWEQECQSIKANLVKEDPQGSGRVRLSDFYRRSMEGEWRFGESEAYLRELGLLDDSSYWHGPQVIIPNYLLSANNCIITSTYYQVCCINECEARLKQVEDAVQAPVATSEQIAPVVASLMAMDGKTQGLPEVLEGQLSKIAETHRGKVPLHGRLFAQWMHYAFPQECPFPHAAGKAKAQTPQEFGDGYIATLQEKRKHARQSGKNFSVPLPSNLTAVEHAGMSQWLHEEELLADYEELRVSPVLGPKRLLVAVVILGALALLARSLPGGPLGFLPETSKQKDAAFGGMTMKQHLV